MNTNPAPQTTGFYGVVDNMGFVDTVDSSGRPWTRQGALATANDTVPTGWPPNTSLAVEGLVGNRWRVITR